LGAADDINMKPGRNLNELYKRYGIHNPYPEPRRDRSIRVEHALGYRPVQIRAANAREHIAMTIADPNRVILTGENPFIRLSTRDGDPETTNASYWRILFCPAGPGHVLYVKSELTQNRWRIYADNIAMARWLQKTVQGMLNPELLDISLPVVDAAFSKSGDPRYFWTERISARDEEIALTWYDIGDPLLIHTQPNQVPGRQYGVCTVLVPALGARLSLNGKEASGQPWKREREGRPFSTCALAFSESWTDTR
jgi:hypothetical protein